MKRFFQIISPVVFSLLLGGCLIGTDLLQDPVAGPYYFWAFEAPEQTSFIEEDAHVNATMASATPIIIVDAPVTAVGWDNRWVLIRQKLVNFYIFDMHIHQLYGPYNDENLKNNARNWEYSKILNSVMIIHAVKGNSI